LAWAIQTFFDAILILEMGLGAETVRLLNMAEVSM
jgi:hypothetical protein